MSFYDEIHRYYEALFPAGKAQVDFLAKILSDAGASAVLDAACGTGAYSRALAASGFLVTGIDYEESMVEEAIKRSSGLERQPAFRQGDLRLLDALNREFDAVLCLGNSLPHLLTDEDLTAFFTGSRSILQSPGGLLILQTVNFDRVVGNEDYHFPVMRREGGKLEFARRYTPRRDGLLDFHTELVLRREGSPVAIKNSVPLRPLLKDDLNRYLDSKDYDSAEYYGSFDFEAWSPQSAATILVAKTGF